LTWNQSLYNDVFNSFFGKSTRHKQAFGVPIDGTQQCGSILVRDTRMIPKDRRDVK
jgi:hypothetical protein